MQTKTHTTHILNHDGDIVISWNPEEYQDECEMRSLYQTLIAQGYEAYAIEPNNNLLDLICGSSHSNRLMTEFDNEIGKMLLRKRVVLTPSTVQGGYPCAGMSEGRL